MNSQSCSRQLRSPWPRRLNVDGRELKLSCVSGSAQICEVSEHRDWPPVPVSVESVANPFSRLLNPIDLYFTPPVCRPFPAVTNQKEPTTIFLAISMHSIVFLHGLLHQLKDVAGSRPHFISISLSASTAATISASRPFQWFLAQKNHVNMGTMTEKAKIGSA
jgi:hypothetical protein